MELAIIFAYSPDEIVPVSANYEAEISDKIELLDNKPALLNQDDGEFSLIIRNDRSHNGSCLADSWITFGISDGNEEVEEHVVAPMLDFLPFAVLFQKQFMEAKVASEMAMNQIEPLDTSHLKQIEHQAKSFLDAFAKNSLGEKSSDEQVAIGIQSLQETLSKHIDGDEDFYQKMWHSMVEFYTPAFNYLGMKAVMEERADAERLMASLNTNDLH